MYNIMYKTFNDLNRIIKIIKQIFFKHMIFKPLNKVTTAQSLKHSNKFAMNATVKNLAKQTILL